MKQLIFHPHVRIILLLLVIILLVWMLSAY